MTAETNILSISYPADEYTFETWGLRIAQYEIGDPTADFYGRRGQNQYGIDVIATRGGASRVGIQCKKRENASDTEIEKLFREDFNKCLSIDPPLTEFIFCTTHPTSTNLQNCASHLQAGQHKLGRKMKVVYMGYDTVQNIIRRYPDLEHKIRFSRNANVKKPLYSEKEAGQENTSQQKNSNLLSIHELDDIHEPIIKLYTEQFNSGKPSLAIEGLLNIAQTNLPKLTKAKIFTIVGQIYHRLNDIPKAIDYTQKAIDLDNLSSLGKLRKAFLSYLQNDFEDCVETAKELFTNCAENDVRSEAASFYLFALAEIISPNIDPLSSIPDDLKKSEQVCTVHVHCLDRIGLDSSDVANKYLALHPNNLFLRIKVAQSPIIKIIDQLGREDLRYQAKDEEVTALKNSCQKLDKIWQEIKDHEHAVIVKDVPINLIIAYIWLNESEKAFSLSREIIEKFPDLQWAQHLHIELLQEYGDSGELDNYINSLEDKRIFWDLYLVEKHFKEGNIQKAQEVAENIDIEFLENNRSHVGFFTLLAMLAMEQKNYELTKKYLHKERELNPQNITPYLTEMEMLEVTGGDQNQISLIMDEAFAIIKKDASLYQRVIFAIFLRARGKLTEAIDLLGGRVSLTIPSRALRLYLELLLEEGNHLETFQRIYRDIPSDVHEKLGTKPLYINFLLNISDFQKAEKYAKDLASNEPPNYHNKLTYARILLRNEKWETLKDYLESLGDIPLDAPEALVGIGYLNFTFGNKTQGIEQIYACALLNQNDQKIARDYVILFMAYGQELEQYFPEQIERVQIGHAVELRNGEKHKIWVIENNADLIPPSSQNYVSSTSPVAKKLIGRKLGDKIKIRPNDGEEWNISRIMHKEIYLYSIIQETLWEKHEEIDGLERIHIETTPEGKPEFEPILSRLRQRSQTVMEVWDIYQNNPIPFRTLGHALGSEVWEVYNDLPSLKGNLKVCEGKHEERRTAIEAISENEKKGFVADLLTCWIIYKFGLLDTVRKVLGRPFISNHSKDKIFMESMQFADSRTAPAGTMCFRNGQYHFIEYSEQELEQQRQEQQNFKDFIDQFGPIAAIGKQDISLPPYIKNDAHFLDDAQAASGQGCILLSEDWVYRLTSNLMVSTGEHPLLTTWLQPVLMVALDKALISKEEYFCYVYKLIENKHYFTSISSDFVLYGMLNEDIENEKILATLINPNSELGSLYSVSLDFLNSLWAKEIQEAKKEQFTLDFLNYYYEVRDEMEAKVFCYRLFEELSSGDSRLFVGKHFITRETTLRKRELIRFLMSTTHHTPIPDGLFVLPKPIR